MPKGGKLTLATSSGGPARTTDWHGVAPRAVPHAVVTVTDTGCGMDEQVKAHLFEPFFTTKEQGKGTGLGLATVYGIIQQAGGHIVVSSAPGQGTTFQIYLPLADAGPMAGADRAARTGAASGKETVLLVEDEEGVRVLARRALLAKGYRVLEARDGMEALKLYERCPTRIDVVVTDVVMPLLGGAQLVERLRQCCPELKALFMSGYHDSALMRHGATAGLVAVLLKPFRPDELVQQVREVLDGPQPARSNG
jgi:CheY-like chemotaxis protein